MSGRERSRIIGIPRSFKMIACGFGVSVWNKGDKWLMREHGYFSSIDETHGRRLVKMLGGK